MKLIKNDKRKDRYQEHSCGNNEVKKRKQANSDLELRDWTRNVKVKKYSTS